MYWTALQRKPEPDRTTTGRMAGANPDGAASPRIGSCPSHDTVHRPGTVEPIRSGEREKNTAQTCYVSRVGTPGRFQLLAHSRAERKHRHMLVHHDEILARLGDSAKITEP